MLLEVIANVSGPRGRHKGCNSDNFSSDWVVADMPGSATTWALVGSGQEGSVEMGAIVCCQSTSVTKFLASKLCKVQPELIKLEVSYRFPKTLHPHHDL